MAQDFWGLILGPQLVGILVNTWLFGIVFVQSYDYLISQSVHKDRPVIRIVVFTIFVLETAHTVLSLITGYAVFVSGWGNLAELLKVQWSFHASSVLTSTIGTVVQNFFAWRIKVLTGRNSFVILILLFSYASIGASAAFTIKLASYGYWTSLPKIKDIVLVAFTTSFISDFMITASLVWFLRSRKGELANDGLVSRIITYTVQTNALTFTWIAWTIFLFFRYPTTLLDAAFYFNVSKIASISLLSSLNRRASWIESPRTISTSPSNQVRQHRGYHSSDSIEFVSFSSEDSSMSRPEAMKSTFEHNYQADGPAP